MRDKPGGFGDWDLRHLLPVPPAQEAKKQKRNPRVRGSEECYALLRVVLKQEAKKLALPERTLAREWVTGSRRFMLKDKWQPALQIGDADELALRTWFLGRLEHGEHGTLKDGYVVQEGRKKGRETASRNRNKRWARKLTRNDVVEWTTKLLKLGVAKHQIAAHIAKEFDVTPQYVRRLRGTHKL
jgi:hypothetical protein